MNIMMSAFWPTVAAALAFAVSAALGKVLIPVLHKLKYGQTILDIGPSWHKKKQGTPTMGGIMFIAGTLIATVLCLCLYSEIKGEASAFKIKVWAGLLMALGFACIGFFDDYIKVVKKRNLGLTAKQKTLLQLLVICAYLFAVYLTGNGATITFIPFFGFVDVGFLFYPAALICIYFFVNAVNLTDGVDGLATSVTFIVAIAFMMMTNIFGLHSAAVMSAALAGGCLGFLIWNFYPAKVFMGDTGSMFLGGMVCALAFAVNAPILLLLMGIIYLAEALSVVIQVTYFKITHGKRIFKMSPIHHHFEMCGWSEIKIVLVFTLITFIGCALAGILFYFGR